MVESRIDARTPAVRSLVALLLGMTGSGDRADQVKVLWWRQTVIPGALSSRAQRGIYFAAFEHRTGQQLGDDNVWLAARRQEQHALGRVIVKLEHTRLADGTVRAVRGAGVAARTDAITDKRDNS